MTLLYKYTAISVGYIGSKGLKAAKATLTSFYIRKLPPPHLRTVVKKIQDGCQQPFFVEFVIFFQKGNQNVRNHQRNNTSNLNEIQPTI